MKELLTARHDIPSCSPRPLPSWYMSCECDDSSVVSQSSTFLSLLLPLSGGGRGGGQILRHDFCAFELTTMEGRGEEEEEEGEGRRRESGANEERHYTAAVKTLVEYIYSSRLRLRGRARSEAAGGRQPTARDCVLLVRGRRRSYFSLFMRVSQRVKGVVIPNGGRGRKGAD